MVFEAIKKMKTGKAPGPSGTVAEVLKASGDDGIVVITHLVNALVKKGVKPKDWGESYIISLYKGDALMRGIYQGLKLLEQVMKVLERILEKLIQEKININDMQFVVIPSRGTTYDIWRRHLIEFLVRVPGEVFWWALRKVGLDEWIIQLAQTKYANTTSSV